MAKRKLTLEDKAIWKKVTENTKPLCKIIMPSKDETAVKRMVKTPKIVPVAPEVQTQSTLSKVKHSAPKPGKFEVHMNQKTFFQMTRGRMEPDAKIDLHGYTLSEAFPVLRKFVQNNYKYGHRLVLVITGKGTSRKLLPDETGSRGVLRHQVPKWLALPGFVDKILQVHQAHLRHGGSGALYVYLRRQKKM